MPPAGSRSPRPGFGLPHPGLARLLGSLTPAAVERVSWPGGIVADVAAFPCPHPVPRGLVMSVRCIVRVGGRIVVCQAPGMMHVWPGGRRLPGEGYRATARREVYEETGWIIGERACLPLGFLHIRLRDGRVPGGPWPHPDFLQLVYTAESRAHDGPDPEHWADLEGWETGHRLLAPADLSGIPLQAVQRAFLGALPGALAPRRPRPAGGAVGAAVVPGARRQARVGGRSGTTR